MPFLAPIGAAIGGAITGAIGFLTGGTLLSKVVLAGLSIAARVLLNRNTTPERQPAQASQLETSYGEDQPRLVLAGKGGTAGHHVYRNAYGPGNRIIQDVFVLSHFRIHDVTRVRYKGEWKTLGDDVDPERGLRIIGTDAEVWVKIYHGTMDQAADTGLVAHSNPPGRWTVNHRGAGVAYAVVTSVLDREHLPSPWEPLFEVEGAPLYDWRRDSSVGGSGAHRWNDQSTWEYGNGIGTNPVLMMYALERGIFNGAELMVGKQVPAGNLPLAEWTLAANICDESVGGTRRYQASCIVSSGSGSTHSANMEPLLNACAGSWIELVGQEYPIAGANQASVATFTDDDIITGEAYRFSAKRERAELVNTVAGSFIHDASFYQSVPFTTRIDEAARAADRERLAVSIPFTAVTVPECVDRLADLAIRASRYQASAELVLRPKFLGLKPGQWVTWNSARNGTRVMQVISKQLGALAANSARNVYLTLQEVGAGIFDPTAYATMPPDGIGRGEPDFLSELDNFQVSGFTVENDAGKRYSAIRATWNDISDPTVVGIDFQYRPKTQVEAIQEKNGYPSDRTVAVLSNGVISSTLFEVRTRLVTRPYRVVPWSVWHDVMTPSSPWNDVAIPPALEAEIDASYQRALAFMGEGAREAREAVRRLAMYGLEQDGANVLDKQELRTVITATAEKAEARYENVVTLIVVQEQVIAQRFETVEASIADKADASVVSFIQASVSTLGGQVEALSEAQIATQAQVGNFYAGGIIRMQQIATESGAQSTAAISVAASAGAAPSQAAIILNAKAGGISEIGLIADRTFFRHGSNSAQVVVFQDGAWRMNIAHIGTVTAGILRSGDNLLRLDLAGKTFVIAD